MDFRQRPLAIVDVETTGDNSLRHETLEIGLLVVRQNNLEIIDEMNEKVKPHHMERAMPVAYDVAGYNEKDWQDAKELSEIMSVFSQKTKDAVLTSYNVSFDWSFIAQAFHKTGVKNLMDYHRLDIMSMFWQFSGGNLESIRLKKACEMFGIEAQPEIHRAIDDAHKALEVLKKLKNHHG
jgi:DNA polymerase-3 subunit epsilon